MQRLEEIALEAYLPVYGQDAVEIGSATCLRAPLAPGSPMLNRVVGLGLDGAVAEHDLDDALAAMGETTFYVDVSPYADTRLDALLGQRGLARGLGWMLFERGPAPAPTVETSLEVVEVGDEQSDVWARVVATGYDLPDECRGVLARVPSLPAWTAFLAFARDQPAAAAAVWTEPPAAYFGFAATLADHRGKGGQGALVAARIERALEAGCRILVTETGEASENRPGPSYRNILRFGFEERHVVPHRLRVRQSTAA
jgi:GNAT superfamily N-acetyltransferase